ncbi:hypothetical protein [Enorma phocaeensis]|uniref:Uncharacterized protein n=1 Tax=Enorma phocaeensis TaxID=1871019 RepID=A0A921IV01_9ACTN|nr:hypothetical protein [Enorma phocaeensis]HJG37779.1 hypothetical protein [Enorma phocaeensis]
MPKNRASNSIREDLRRAVRDDRRSFIVFLVLRALVVITLVRCVFTGRFEHVLLCILVLFLLLLPSFLESKLNIDLPDTLECILLFFIFAAEILGEIDSFYLKIPFWDTILHTTWGFICAGIGFALVDILNRGRSASIHLSPAYMAIAAVCFSMTVGACWEIFEYSMDTFMGFDMQKDTIVQGFHSVTLDPTQQNIAVPVEGIESTVIELADGTAVTIEGGYLDLGINDTMADLIVNLIGAVAFSILGFTYIRTRDRHSFAAQFIPIVKDAGPHEDPGLAEKVQPRGEADARE